MARVKEVLKNCLIPHQGNDHQPHILRPRTVAFVIVVALVMEAVVLFGSPSFITRTKLFGIIMTNVLVDGTNAARVTDGLPALRENPLLDAAAAEKANDMATNGYFAHTSPSGLTPWYWFEKAGYNFSAAGENLAVNFADAEDVTAAWMKSPEHRANILNAGFTDIGMATAQGTFDGQPAAYVVELFGTPAPVPSISSEAAPVASLPARVAPPAVTVVATSGSSFVAVKGAATEVPENADDSGGFRAGSAVRRDEYDGS